MYVIHISYLSRRKGDPGYTYNTKAITKTAGPVQVCYTICHRINFKNLNRMIKSPPGVLQAIIVYGAVAQRCCSTTTTPGRDIQDTFPAVMFV